MRQIINRMIAGKLLERYGALEQLLNRNEVLFWEGSDARYYYQVVAGNIKMFNYSDEGREFIQGIFSGGRSFGEPPLFGNFPYPASAMAMEDSIVLRLHKDAFFQLLKDHPETHLTLTQSLAERLYYKAMMASELSGSPPQHRILRLLRYLKNDIYQLPEPFAYQVELTRQQIADLTGVGVETAIKAIKKMEQEGTLKIKSRKIWL